jgi:hypothetical protein
MKKIATLAALTAFAFLGACTSSQNTTAPGAVGSKSAACCGKCNNTCKDKAAPGAVGEKKSGCCASKAECSAAKSAPGAVGETKSGCSAAKSECSAAKSAPGAVSGKSDCSTKSGCASKCPATKG